MNIKFFLSIFINSYLIFCQLDNENEEEMYKKTKVLACISISKARMAQDNKFIGNLVHHINKLYSISDGKNKIVSLCLVNCYSRISLEYAFDLIKSQLREDIDPMSDINIQLLGLQDTDANASEIHKESFLKDFQEINKILLSLNKDHNNLKNSKEKISENIKEISQDDEDNKPNSLETEDEADEYEGPSLFEKISEYIFSILVEINFMNFLSILELNSNIGLALWLILLFILLNIFKNMFLKTQKNQKKIKE